MVMAHIKKWQCPHCHSFFFPDHRNAKRQNFCNSNPDCKKASKIASQKRWLAKNPDYFKGAEHVQRVQEWRKANPGRGRRKAESTLLQDDCLQKSSSNQGVSQEVATPEESGQPVLQDILIVKHPVFIGLIAHLTGLALQDDIAAVAIRLEQLGQDVLSRSTLTKGGHSYDPKVPCLSRPHPHHSSPVQLGGSPAGP